MSDEPQAQFERGMQVALTVAAAHQPLADAERLCVSLVEGIDAGQTDQVLNTLRVFVLKWREAHRTERGN